MLFRELSFWENNKTDIPARNIPTVAMKYPTIRSDPNHVSKIAEYSPTSLGPNMDPNTENHTARDNAVALKLSEATNDATYLVWRAADCPIPNMNAPNNKRINESINRE